MLRIEIVLLIVIASLFSGCASTEQARSIQLLGVMNDSHSGPQTDHEGQGSQRYRHPTVNWSTYDKVLLQPVTIREGLSSKLRVQERHDLLLLAGSFEDKLYLKLSKDYDMVEKPMAGTMLIQVAITHLEERSTAPAIWTNVAQALQAVATIYTLAGKPLFTGAVTAEFTIRDAQTGQLLAAGVDQVAGEQHRTGRKISGSWCDVKTGLDSWTDLSTYRLCVLRGGSHCVEPKA